jgi:predicted RNA-binding protein with EMAP domain
MKTEKEIGLLLSNIEEQIINYESVLNSGLSKKDKKNLIEVVQQLQSELNLLKWVLNEESNSLPF